MNAIVESQTQLAPASCAHCGLAVPPALVRVGESEQFCCAGCRQVYTLVREWGLDQYYRLVDRQQGSLEPAQVSGRSFEDFDDGRAQADATESMAADRRRTRLYLEGVHCAACVWLVEKLPSVLAGVDEVRLNYVTAVAEITWHPANTKLSTIARALDRLGYTPHMHRASRIQDARRSEDRAMLSRLGVATAGAMNLMFVSGALYAGDYSGMAASYHVFFRWFALLIAIPVLAYAAKPFFQTAIAGLKAGMVHIDLPIAVAIAVAGSASAINAVRGSGPIWFDSLTMLVAALLGARQLQRSALRAAIERADSLRGVAFLEFARRVEGDGPAAPVVEVPLTALAPGDRVEVRSGELVPVDGVVLSGRSSLNNAVLTGESTAQPVAEGDAVNAGATNLGARLIVRVEAAGERTRVGSLLAIVQEALSRKPALLRTTDVMARRFVQALLVVAIATAAAVAVRHGWEVATERVVALLVVSCPCALGLAVPLAMSVALMRAAQAGIFIKDPDALERLRQVETVLLDKTGTLTEGRPAVVRWYGPDLSLEFARALEAESSHVVARAFQAATPKALHVVRRVEQILESAGRGIEGRVDGHDVRVGNRAHAVSDIVRDRLAAVAPTLLSLDIARDDPEPGEGSDPRETRAVPDSVDLAAAGMVADGLSPVFVAVDGLVQGVAGIGDAIRPDARQTIAALKSRGVRVRILSGDDAAVVARVGAQLDLPADDVLGALTPEAKKDVIAGLVERRDRSGAVVMVGDGVNDAAALALADVGIAVHGGTGATVQAADVVLTREGVGPVIEVLNGARALRGVIRRNTSVSLVYNLVASSAAIAGLVGPLLAAVLMPMSSLTVVLSSSLTKTFSRSPHKLPRRGPCPAPAEASVGG